MREIRYAVRSLLRTPAFTVATVLTLAIGIGAATAIYSIVDTILFRPLPFPGGDRLIKLVEYAPHFRDGQPPLEDTRRQFFSSADPRANGAGRKPNRARHRAAGAKYLQSMLFVGVEPRDPATIAAVTIAFAVVAMIASYLPARRATRVYPMVALRVD